MPRWLKQIGSCIISFIIYAWLLNPKVALVLLGGIVFHECGHLYAAKYMGLKTNGLYIIPFVGGVSLIAGKYQRYSQMSFVLLAGPIAGAILSLIFYLLYLCTGNVFIGTSAYWMAWLNLFNLIPLAMLDAGQLVEAILYSINDKVAAVFLTASYAIGAILIGQINIFIAAWIIFLGVSVVWAAWRKISWKRQGLESLLPYQPQQMNARKILVSIICYLLTVTMLLIIIYMCKGNYLHIMDLFKS